MTSGDVSGGQARLGRLARGCGARGKEEVRGKDDPWDERERVSPKR